MFAAESFAHKPTSPEGQIYGRFAVFLPQQSSDMAVGSDTFQKGKARHLEAGMIRTRLFCHHDAAEQI